MIDVARVERALRQKYPDLLQVGARVYRGVDRHADHDYAIRYFDVSDELPSIAGRLRKYHEDVLSEMYFSGQAPTDLRWNQYLYFVTSDEVAGHSEFRHSKAIVESDREYARKQVVLERDLEAVLLPRKRGPSQILPEDLATSWRKRLDELGLGYVLDDLESVPGVVQRIGNGDEQRAASLVTPSQLNAAEKTAVHKFLKDLTIRGFRPHPVEKEHLFGKVNLICGTNGVGKTSLLEAIEYLYCGKNTRPGPLLPGTSVSAHFRGSANVLSTSDRLDRARLRARNSNWYAKTDLRAVTVNSSFGKFNFLNTDAAVHLSLENSDKQLTDDVVRLLLGAEAERLFDRMRRVKEQVDGASREAEALHSTKEELRKGAEAGLARLRSAPRMSDSLFSETVTSLKKARWSRLPKDKLQLHETREELQAAMTAIAMARGAGFDVLVASAEDVEKRRDGIEAVIRKLDRSIERERVATIEAVEVTRRFEAASRHGSALDVLHSYVAENFQALMSHSSALRQMIGALRARLGGLAQIIAPDASAVGSRDLLARESAAVARRLAEGRNSLQQAQDALGAFEATQSSLAILRQRLVGVARELMEVSADPRHCPVCKTCFEDGELLRRMLPSSSDGAQVQLKELGDQVASWTETVRSAESVATTLGRLAEFVGPVLSLTVTVGDAWTEVQSVKNSLVEAESELASASERLRHLQDVGLDPPKLAQALASAGLNELPTGDHLEELRKAAAVSILGAATAREDVQQRVRAARQESAEAAAGMGFDSKVSSNDVLVELRARLARIDAARHARASLSAVIDLQSSQTLEALSVQLEASQRVLLRLVTAQAKEEVDGSAAASEIRSTKTLASEAKAARIKVNRFKRASELLEELQRESGANLAERILAENAGEIGETFGMIHSPREFELQVEDGKLKILRKQSGKGVELSEMSTGQRSAYALSLFLAMNARLSSGPPVLLFDDPISHVDDINVLSFLDHLRDIAIRGTRQIFFATADTKLAGLFRHKFRFLGEADFVEIALSRGD